MCIRDRFYTERPSLGRYWSGLQQGVVKCDVTQRARVPAEIACHAVLLQLTPDFLVAIRGHRALDCSEQRSARGRSEHESGRALVLQRICAQIDDRVVQTAGVAVSYTHLRAHETPEH